MLGLAKKIYEKTPKRLLRILVEIPDYLLFGLSYRSSLKQVSYDIGTVGKKLYFILTYARENTAYGRDVIPASFSREEVFSIHDGLPFMTSEDLSANLNYYTSSEFDERNSYTTTTGGTGRKATTIRLSNESYTTEWAHMHSVWEKIGYDRRRHLKLTLRGKSITSEKLTAYNPIYNEVVVDTFRLNRSRIPDLLFELKDYKIEYIHGYPSLIKEFMEYLRLHGEHFPVLGIMLGSEGVSKDERTEIEQFFGAKTVAWYGQSEKVILGDDDLGDGIYSVFSSYGYPCLYEAENGFGEIAGTSFVNRALPLIKYRTGDFGRLLEEGGVLKLSDIRGRWGKDFVYLNPDKRIPTTSINLHSDIQKEIFYYQIHQKEFGRITIKILPKPSVKSSMDSLLARFQAEMKKSLNGFEIKCVIAQSEKEIVKSPRGKAKMLVQEIDTLKAQL